jgi:hypothetical protein
MGDTHGTFICRRRAVAISEDLELLIQIVLHSSPFESFDMMCHA